MTIIRIDTGRIRDWTSFHYIFAEAFRFPSYYGKNMNAWVDCMSDLTETVTLQLDDVDDFEERCPELFRAIIECSALVNWRQVEAGAKPLLALSFHKSASGHSNSENRSAKTPVAYAPGSPINSDSPS